MGIFSRLFRKDEEETDVEQYQRQIQNRRQAQASESWHAHPSDEPEQQTGTLLLEVEDTFSITGRGTVVTGQAQAHFSVGERVQAIRPDGGRREAAIGGIEAFRRALDTAHPGDNVGVLLRGIGKADVCRGTRLERF